MSFDIVGELKKSKEYRTAYIAAHVRNGVAFQLRAMREARGWDQREVACRLGNVKLQPVISRYENPDYGRFSVSTLLDLAAAFDVALVVRFAPFREVVGWESNLSMRTLNVPSFPNEDKALTFDVTKLGTFPLYSQNWNTISTFVAGNTNVLSLSWLSTSISTTPASGNQNAFV